MSEFKIKVNKHPEFSAWILEKAFDAPRMAYTPYDRINTHNELCGSGALLYLLLWEHYYPGTKSRSGETAVNRILEHLHYFLLPGNEPSMRVGPYWGYPVTAAALTLLKKSPAIWALLTDDEKRKIDEIMRCFAVTCSWATTDVNDYFTGPELRGNYKKSWNPNHRITAIIPILFATIYFDSVDKVNEMLTGFDYDEFVAMLEREGFTSAKATVTTAGKKLMEEGGPAFLEATGEPAGEGLGVKHPYVYCKMPLNMREEIFSQLLCEVCSGGKVVNEVRDEHPGADPAAHAYLEKGSSPVLGMEGMMTELTSFDAKGIRSDITYCAANFCILVPVLAALVALDEWDAEAEKNSRASNLATVGIVDFLYKIENGYHSFSHGKGRHTDESSTHGVYQFAKDMWKAMLS